MPSHPSSLSQSAAGSNQSKSTIGLTLAPSDYVVCSRIGDIGTEAQHKQAVEIAIDIEECLRKLVQTSRPSLIKAGLLEPDSVLPAGAAELTDLPDRDVEGLRSILARDELGEGLQTLQTIDRLRGELRSIEVATEQALTKAHSESHGPYASCDGSV